MEPIQPRTMQCPACDSMISTQAIACPHCGHPMKNTMASPPVRSSEIKSTGTAIVLSFLWTGLGQLYAGCIPRGIILMLLTPIIWTLAWFGGFVGVLGSTASLVQTAYSPAPAGAGGVGITGLILAFAGVAWWVWGMVDAKNLCEAFNRQQATGDGITPEQQFANKSQNAPTAQRAAQNRFVTFDCPHCGTTIYQRVAQCMFCDTPLTNEAIEAAAEAYRARRGSR
jgi:TM2 domain-containing membrane protein YozV/predicted RNA-binding Zn-ribbon protein involved in translation (DUF1610 family)